MKRILGVVTGDWHLSSTNYLEIEELVKQLIQVCKEHNTPTIYNVGDVFTSRKSQELITLKSFERILDMLHDNGITMYTIPGNHDKTNYKSNDSFLDSYRYHPSLKLFTEPSLVEDEEFQLFFIPFYDEEEVFVEKFKELPEPNPSLHSILFLHQGITGVKNNDKMEVENNLRQGWFKKFSQVFVGHYHDRSTLGKNICYIGSLRQNNYGEDKEKGCVVVYLDEEKVGYEFINLKFTPYTTVKIDLDTIGYPELLKKAEEYSKQEGYTRFIFSGSSDKKLSLPKETFSKLGIDIKFTTDEIIGEEGNGELPELVEFDNEQLLEKFKEFLSLYYSDMSDEEKSYGQGIIEKILK